MTFYLYLVAFLTPPVDAALFRAAMAAIFCEGACNKLHLVHFIHF